jgi:hypothetical protein
LSGPWHSNLGGGEIFLGRLDDAAIMKFRRLTKGTDLTFPAFLAGAEAAKGNDAEANVSLAEARRLNPQLPIKWFLENWPVPPMIVGGLRKVGLPEE